MSTTVESKSDPRVGLSLQAVEEQSHAPLLAAIDHADMQPDASSPPVDRYHLGYIVFLILGFASLFPWNIFIKNGYFRSKFAEEPSFLTWVSTVFMIASLLTLTVLALWPTRILPRLASPTIVKISLTLNGLVFALLAILPWLDALAMSTLFALVLTLTALSGLCAGLIQNGLFSLASQFPSIYMQAIAVGQGLAGVLSSIAFLVAVYASIADYLSGHVASGGRGSLPETLVPVKDSATSTCIYFIASSVVILGSLTVFVWFEKRQLYRYYYYYSPHRPSNPDKRQEQGQKPCSKTLEHNANEQEASTHGPLCEDHVSFIQPASSYADLKLIFTTLPCALYPWGIFLVFFITFAAFPAFFTNIVSSVSKPNIYLKNLFSPTAFLIYDIGDCVGKWLPGLASLFYIQSHGWAFAMPLFRILLIPLLMLCQFQLFDSQGQPSLFPGAPRLIQSDAVYCLLVLAFGLSNGYAGCLLLMKAPGAVADTRLKEKMGQIMALFLGLGLAVGPLLSFGLMAILCQCNPF